MTMGISSTVTDTTEEDLQMCGGTMVSHFIDFFQGTTLNVEDVTLGCGSTFVQSVVPFQRQYVCRDGYQYLKDYFFCLSSGIVYLIINIYVTFSTLSCRSFIFSICHCHC